MARSPKKTLTAAPLSPRASVSAPPASPPPVRIWAADAGDDGMLVLYKDSARGVLLIGPADLEQPLRLATSACEVLVQHGFAASSPDGPWTRQIDQAAVLQDRLDGERVLLTAAELHRDSPGRSADRRSR